MSLIRISGNLGLLAKRLYIKPSGRNFSKLFWNYRKHTGFYLADCAAYTLRRLLIFQGDLKLSLKVKGLPGDYARGISWIDPRVEYDLLNRRRR